MFAFNFLISIFTFLILKTTISNFFFSSFFILMFDNLEQLYFSFYISVLLI